jgi:transposase
MPRERLSMRKLKEILRLHQAGLTQRQIARSCGVSHTAVAQYLARATQAGLSWPVPETWDEAQLHAVLFAGPAPAAAPGRPLPAMDYLHQELKRKGVTLQLLWEEYRTVHPDGYGYTQFCEYYSRWKQTLDLPLRQTYRAGEKTFVDWAGLTIPWMNTGANQTEAAVLFIAVLGASNYTFAEAFANQQLESWIDAHCHAFAFFGGVTELVIPDNVRTGVSRPCYYEPQIHRTYAEMAAHYGTVVLPARPYAPRDKAKAESGVQYAEHRLLAPLRHQTFFGVGQINQALQPLLQQLNAQPFQKLQGSRQQLFEQLDRPALRPLPDTPYQLGEWRNAQVNIDYHVQVDWHYYSVPYPLVHQPVEVRLTARMVELFHHGRRVALHRRSFQRGGFTTDPSHRPKAHQQHLEWTPSRLIDWAHTLGPATGQLVATLLARKPHPEQGYRACLGIMRLAKDYGPPRLEAACRRALALDSCTYHSVASILKTKMDSLPLPRPAAPPPPAVSDHGNLRGAAYYHRPLPEDRGGA